MFDCLFVYRKDIELKAKISLRVLDQFSFPLGEGGWGIEIHFIMKHKSYYNKEHKYLARELRSNGTPGEQILWTEVLQSRKFYEYQFNRQFPIQNYIVDFICRKLKLIIEIDGYSHRFKYEEDKHRDADLYKLGYTVLRFAEKEIRDDLDNVIRTLEYFLPDTQSP